MLRLRVSLGAAASASAHGLPEIRLSKQVYSLRASGLDSREVGNKIGDLAYFSGLRIKFYTCEM